MLLSFMQLMSHLLDQANRNSRTKESNKYPKMILVSNKTSKDFMLWVNPHLIPTRARAKAINNLINNNNKEVIIKTWQMIHNSNKICKSSMPQMNLH
jgi:hypothetical protein